jgi:hypothetical protein
MPVTAPCESCRHKTRCAEQSLACSAFLIFKRVSPAPERWACAPRFPSADIFEPANAPIEVKAPVYRKRVVAEDVSEE